jgi:hypothetical protein
MKNNDKRLRAALAYLRGGSALGGKPIEHLIKEAADAIDPSVTTGPRGIGVAYPNVRQAVLLLIDVANELGLALGAQQEQTRQTEVRRTKVSDRRKKAGMSWRKP